MKTSKFFFSFTALLLSLLCSSLQASAYDYSDSYSSYYYDGMTEMEDALRKGHAAATLEDYVKAESYYLQAADLGSAEAQCALGILYSDSSLTLYDPTKALYDLNESAKNGYSYAKYYLAICLIYGICTDIDYVEGFYWMKLAADDYVDEAISFIEQINATTFNLQNILTGGYSFSYPGI